MFGFADFKLARSRTGDRQKLIAAGYSISWPLVAFATMTSQLNSFGRTRVGDRLFRRRSRIEKFGQSNFDTNIVLEPAQGVEIVEDATGEEKILGKWKLKLETTPQEVVFRYGATGLVVSRWATRSPQICRSWQPARRPTTSPRQQRTRETSSVRSAEKL